MPSEYSEQGLQAKFKVFKPFVKVNMLKSNTVRYSAPFTNKYSSGEAHQAKNG